MPCLSGADHFGNRPWWQIADAEPLEPTQITVQNLKLDARSAPGGTVDDFELQLMLRAAVPFSLQPTMTVDGVVINTPDFVTQSASRGPRASPGLNLTYNGTSIEGFGGIADFGTVMPTGLSLRELHHNLAVHTYSTPATGSEERTFRLIMEVPEPADLNMDGFVDGLDLGILLANFDIGTTPDMGELDGTPPVDGLDLGILLGAWNPPSRSPAATIPEPSTIMSILE